MSGRSLPSSLVGSSVTELTLRVAEDVGGGALFVACAGALRVDGPLSPGGGASEDLEFRWLVVVEGGGIADVLRLAAVVGGCMLCLGLGAVLVGGFFPTGGVLVLDVDVLETPLLPSCFVGDFAGDRNPLKPDLGTGVGVSVIALALLPGPSTRLCLFSPLAALCVLVGLLFPANTLAEAFGFALTSSNTCRTPVGRKNIPYPCSH